MASTVLSLRMDEELLARLRKHAAKRGMSVQDYVVRTLMRDDFDERFKAAVDETERFYGPGAGPGFGPGAAGAAGIHGRPGR
ncbi:ribbon-helix-helix protein, CopG family [Streptomyces sp. SCSIO 30461]|uniref:ribbon-helix-helix protein, CopG family n=1 Tax=Streptomyces sp. SCSIO 30461 TaxID=3118085 RepID=UPI00387E4E41